MSIKDGPGEGSWAAFAEKVVAERDAANEAAACDRSALDHCITAMRAAEADRDAARAELKKLEDALVAREMTYCVRGNDLWDLGFVLQEDRNKERWRADQAESALKSLHEAAFLYRDLTRSFGDETADGGDLDRALDEAARG